MPKLYFRVVVVALCLAALLAAPFPSAATRSSSIEDYKAQVAADVASMAKQSQVMVDMVFSFGELGFQEVETAKYLTGVLEKEGFKIERGIAGIPTAWVATWGSGKPVIALGSDVDCIPQASQKPGVAYTYREQMRKFYYNPDKYGTYLEQLGIKYPTVREGATQSGRSQN